MAKQNNEATGTITIIGAPVPNNNKGVLDIKTVLKLVLETEVMAENPLTQQMEINNPLHFMACKLVHQAMRGDIQSVKEVFERLEGKSTQNVNLEADIKNKVIRVGFGKVEDEQQ